MHSLDFKVDVIRSYRSHRKDKTNPPFSLFRTQSNYCRFGQCWEDHHPLPVVSVFLFESVSRRNTWLCTITVPWHVDMLHVSTKLLTFLCLVLSSLTKEAVQTSPTIGSNVEEIAVKKTRFLIWDIGGQESLRATWNSYYCNTEVRIINLHALLVWQELCGTLLVLCLSLLLRDRDNILLSIV